MQRLSCASTSSKSGSVSRVTSSGKMGVGDGDGREGLHTPAFRGGSCAICLSPLKKKSGGNDREVYTVQLCRVSEVDDRCWLVSSRAIVWSDEQELGQVVSRGVWTEVLEACGTRAHIPTRVHCYCCSTIVHSVTGKGVRQQFHTTNAT